MCSVALFIKALSKARLQESLSLHAEAGRVSRRPWEPFPPPDSGGRVQGGPRPLGRPAIPGERPPGAEGPPSPPAAPAPYRRWASRCPPPGGRAAQGRLRRRSGAGGGGWRPGGEEALRGAPWPRRPRPVSTNRSARPPARRRAAPGPPPPRGTLGSVVPAAGGLRRRLRPAPGGRWWPARRLPRAFPIPRPSL